MKTIIKIIISIIMISAIVGIVSCTTSKPITTEIAVLRDITDKQITQPEPMQIIPLFNLSEKFRELFLIIRNFD